MSPLKAGKNKRVFSENVSEFTKGKTFAKTKNKFGKKKAIAQSVAIAYSVARKSGSKPRAYTLG